MLPQVVSIWRLLTRFNWTFSALFRWNCLTKTTYRRWKQWQCQCRLTVDRGCSSFLPEGIVGVPLWLELKRTQSMSCFSRNSSDQHVKRNTCSDLLCNTSRLRSGNDSWCVVHTLLERQQSRQNHVECWRLIVSLLYWKKLCCDRACVTCFFVNSEFEEITNVPGSVPVLWGIQADENRTTQASKCPDDTSIRLCTVGTKWHDGVSICYVNIYVYVYVMSSVIVAHCRAAAKHILLYPSSGSNV